MNDKDTRTRAGVGDFLLDLETLSRRYSEDSEFRSRMVSGDAAGVLSEFGLDTPANMELQVSANTEDVVHFVFPPDPNVDLEDEDLSSVSGGVRQSTASSASCIACLPSTVSCGACLSTVHPDG